MKAKSTIAFYLFALLIALGISPAIHAQSFVHTRPLQILYPLNPNVQFETFYSKRMSLEVEAIYRSHTWDFNSGEYNYGGWKSTIGYSIGISQKYYFYTNSLGERFYAQVRGRYTSTNSKNLEQKDFNGNVIRIIDKLRAGPELNLLVGLQSYGDRANINYFVGGGTWWLAEKQTHVLGDLFENDESEYSPFSFALPKLFVGITVNYMVIKPKKVDKRSSEIR